MPTPTFSTLPNLSYDKTISCLDLAPAGFFEKQMNISKGALGALFKSWHSAILDFLDSRYLRYDALVGENACHIRAFVLTELVFLKENDPFFVNYLQEMLLEIKNASDNLENITLTAEDTQSTVAAFIIRHGLIFFIPKQYVSAIKYLIEAWLLTLTKIQHPSHQLTLNEKTSYQPVREWGFAYNRAQYLVHHTQKSLSAFSCHYMIEQSNLLEKNNFSHLLLIKKDAHERQFIPQYFAAKIILQRTLENKKPLLLKVKRSINGTSIDTFSLLLKTNNNQTDFEPDDNGLPHGTCIIIEGVVDYEFEGESQAEYITRLLSHSLLAIILANFASHPQYAGELKNLPPPFEEALSAITDGYPNLRNKAICTILDEKEDFEQKKEYATNHGCALQNPSLLFINHMYGDLISQQAANRIIPDYTSTDKLEINYGQRRDYQVVAGANC